MKKALGILVIVILAVVMWKFFLAASPATELDTYANARQGFEIGIPKDSTVTIGLDEEGGDFSGVFEAKETEVLIRKNAYSETTPPYLPNLFPACRTEKSVVVKDAYSLPIRAFSSSEKIDETDCGDDIKDAHTVFVRFCVGAGGDLYPSEPSEGRYHCKSDFDPEYDINILCHGPGWQGIAGRDRCMDLFSDIIQSFTIVK